MRSASSINWLAALLVAAFLALAFGDVVATSPVGDELTHLAAGWSYLKTGDFRLNPEHPPLVKTLAALPLSLLDVWPRKLQNDGSPAANALLEAWGTAAAAPWGQWFFSHRLFYAVRDRDISTIPTTEPIPRAAFLNDVERIFLVARGTLLVVIGLSLAAVIFFWSRELWGVWGAALSLALFCFDPNFIAHTPLVTTDATISLLMTATLLFFWRCCTKLTPGNAIGFVIAIALAHVTKFSAVLLWPMLLVVALIARPSRRVAGVVAIAIVATWITIWAAYGFGFRASRDPLPTEETVRTWYEKKGTEPGVLGRAVLLAKDARVLPEAYLHGFAVVQSDAINRGAYLNGKITSSGFRSYFFWTFLFKTPVPTIVLIVAGIVAAVRRRPRVAAFLLAPVVIYLAVSIVANLNIGHRHILPVFPLLYVLCGSLARKWLPVAALSAVACLFAAGNHIAYFNVLAGGPENGHKHLIDSNLDWGQDLERLGEWVAANRITEPINLAYSGSGEPRYYGITYVNFQGAYVPVKQVPLSEARVPGLAAVSTNMYVFGPGGDTRFFRNFLAAHRAQEIARVGRTITVYRLR